MKKLFYSVLAVVAVTAVSCNSKSTPASEEVADTTAVVETVDSAVVVTEAEELAKEMTENLSADKKDKLAELSKKAQERISQLIAAGDTAAARAYSAQLKKFVSDNVEKIRSIANGDQTVNSLVNIVSTTSAKDLVEGVKNAVKADADAIASDVEAGVKQKVEDAKADAQAKVENVKAEAKAKAEEAKQNLRNEVNNKVNESAQKANQKINDAANKLLDKLNK